MLRWMLAALAAWIWTANEAPVEEPETWATTAPRPPTECDLCGGTGEEVLLDRPYPCRWCDARRAA